MKAYQTEQQKTAQEENFPLMPFINLCLYVFILLEHNK